MKLTDIQNKIREFIENELKITITAQINLIEQGILDSFTMIKLINFLEEEFDLQIDLDEITPEAFGDIENMSKKIQDLIKNK